MTALKEFQLAQLYILNCIFLVSFSFFFLLSLPSIPHWPNRVSNSLISSSSFTFFLIPCSWFTLAKLVLAFQSNAYAWNTIIIGSLVTNQLYSSHGVLPIVLIVQSRRKIWKSGWGGLVFQGLLEDNVLLLFLQKWGRGGRGDHPSAPCSDGPVYTQQALGVLF